jgi:hypothetical protein
MLVRQRRQVSDTVVGFFWVDAEFVPCGMVSSSAVSRGEPAGLESLTLVLPIGRIASERLTVVCLALCCTKFVSTRFVSPESVDTYCLHAQSCRRLVLSKYSWYALGLRK